MESNEIVNIGKEGAARAEQYNIGSEPWFDAYEELMTLFLKQGGIVISVYVQAIGDDLHIALHGKEGNLMYMRIKDFFVGKTKPPIKENFLLHVTEQDSGYNNVLHLDLEELRNHPNYNQNTESSSRTHAKIRISPTERSRSSREQRILSDLQTASARMSLGISSLSIPIRTVRTLASPVCMRAIRSTNSDGDAVAICLRNIVERKDDIPLVYSTHSGDEQNIYHYNQSSIDDVSLVANLQRGIVYESILPLEMTNINILYALKEGDLKKALSKIAKRRPFGMLQLHYDSEKKIAHMKTVNPAPEQIQDGQSVEGTYEKVDMKSTKPGSIVYRNSRHESAAVSVNYGTIFDTFMSARRGNPSLAHIKSGLKARAPDTPINELIGISMQGNLVMGIENDDVTVLCTVTTLGHPTDIDEEYLTGMEATAPAKKKKKSAPKRDFVTPVVQALEETEPEEPAPDYESSSLYMKWKIYSDTWHQERGLDLSTEVSTVFMTYMNSGEVEQEDIDEYNHLVKN